MNREPQVSKRLRVALLAAVGLAVAAAGGGCAKVGLKGGPAQIRLELTATPDCNTCGANRYALFYRVLQITNTAALSGVTLEKLWDHEESVLGEALVAKSPDAVIDPGGVKEFAVAREAKAKAVVVVGNFCSQGRSAETCWHYVRPLKGSKSVTLKLTAGPSCLSPSRR